MLKSLLDLLETVERNKRIRENAVTVELEGEVAEKLRAESRKIQRERRRAKQVLLNLPGVGPTIGKRMYHAGYKSYQDIAQASLEELLEIEGMGEKTARRIQSLAHARLREASSSNQTSTSRTEASRSQGWQGKYGKVSTHLVILILTGWWTFGLANILYLVYRYSTSES